MRDRSLSRLLVPLDHWPTLHQELWDAGLDPDNLDDDDDPPHGVFLAPATIRNALKGWSRFLTTLDADKRNAADPASLVTPASIRNFIVQLKAADNSNTTIAARIWEIRIALGIMCPAAKFPWLSSPGGTDVRSLFKDCVQRRPPKIHNSKELYALGLRLMDKALLISNPRRRARAFRNGLIVAVLACRAPRLRTLTTPQIGTQLVTAGEGFRLEFRAADLKRKVALEYDLPAGLVSYITHYLAVERPVLLGKKQHLWFWVGQHGRPLKEAGISGALRRLSKALGIPFSAHTFRYALGTKAPMVEPQHSMIAPLILGNSPAVANKYYNLGKQVDAAQRYQAAVAEDRRLSAALARRAFDRAHDL